MATIAITGATGFIGSHTLRQALLRGHAVRALTRRPQPPRSGVVWIAGDLANQGALESLVAGADVVLHIAGAIKAPDRAAFEAFNVAGTGSVIAAARRAGVQRLVHVSSLAAREPGLSEYGRSKARAEDAVRAGGLDWVMVRPPAVYGPGDRDFSEELFAIASGGFLPIPAKGRSSLLYCTDLADLLVILCDAPPDGICERCFEPDDGTPAGVSHRELVSAVAAALGRKVRPVALSTPLLRLMGTLDQVLRRDKAVLTRDRVKYMTHPDWVSNPAQQVPTQVWRPRIGYADGLRLAAEVFLQKRSATATSA